MSAIYPLHNLEQCHLENVAGVTILPIVKGFRGGSAVQNPPAVQEMHVQSLGQEDPLEKGMATQSSILAWRIPWTEEPGRLQSMGSKSWT